MFESEHFYNFFRQKPENFLQLFAPSRVELFKSVLRKIKLNFKGKFIADLLMPSYIGGYFMPAKREKDQILAINPYLLLFGTEKEIAHVLFHESLHAEGIMEEVVVETMTKKKMDELYSGKPFRSGYDGMVNEAKEFFGDLSFNEMQEMIEDKEDEEAFDDLLELIIARPALGEARIEDLTWDGIQKRLKKKWPMLKRLFPRMINSIAKNNKGLHEEAKMEAYQYKLEGLLERVAKQIFNEDQEVLTEILLDVTKDGEINLTGEDIKEKMIKKGYRYIIDQEPEAFDKFVNLFLLQVASLKLNQEEVKLENIEITLG